MFNISGRYMQSVSWFWDAKESETARKSDPVSRCCQELLRNHRCRSTIFFCLEKRLHRYWSKIWSWLHRYKPLTSVVSIAESRNWSIKVSRKTENRERDIRSLLKWKRIWTEHVRAKPFIWRFKCGSTHHEVEILQWQDPHKKLDWKGAKINRRLENSGHLLL